MIADYYSLNFAEFNNTFSKLQVQHVYVPQHCSLKEINIHVHCTCTCICYINFMTT